MEKKEVSIEIVSDPVCPWCYIAKRKLDKAIESRIFHYDSNS